MDGERATPTGELRHAPPARSPNEDGGASRRPSAGIRFRLLTYNIHRAIGIDRRFAPQRIVEILRHHDADIVLLQEVDRGAPRSEHLDLASWIGRHLRYAYRAVGMNVTLRKGRYGNATLTRFPIGRQHNIDLSVRRRIRRGAQHTRIHVPLAAGYVDLDVFNVHLGLSATERRRQVRRLLESPDLRRLSDFDACIVAGDTNDWRGVLLRRHFRPAGWRCATSQSPRRLAIRTFPSFAPAGALDRIYYRGALRLLEVHRSRLPEARLASDHLPVIADFLLAGRADD